ncbi:MAG: cephalosporin hydroxylase [Actinobacteria bacterium]|uniref:Unannotated protein n=1 Tax=freshwater metagenome TaxID=449393 RepID=A0A6J5YQ80_9ZZZZ|nr:cephalosporin hydroxylase [Actinomycetota bacterium]
MTSIPAHQQKIPNAKEFVEMRDEWQSALTHDEQLRSQAVELQSAADKYMYTYQFSWLGVPIIRLPDDIVLYQELIGDIQPKAIVETGIARGGSLVLSASLMQMFGLEPHVFGLDLQIFPHTREAISTSRYSRNIQLWEGDSASPDAAQAVKGFLAEFSEPCLLVLDSDHTHSHVFNELSLLAPLMPAGSVILVADTLIAEMPENAYPNREWTKELNPLSALNEFLETNPGHYSRLDKYGRRALQTEFRDGVILKS